MTFRWWKSALTALGVDVLKDELPAALIRLA